MSNVMVIQGFGRYSDVWHPFAETSAAIASVVEELGFRVDVRLSEPGRLLDLSGVDLLVINSGGGGPGPIAPLEAAWHDAHAALGAYADGGGPMLVVHTGANTFGGWARWPELVGGQWVPGVSNHPRASIATFQAVDGAAGHPIFAGLPAGTDIDAARLRDVPVVQAYDERYSDLVLAENAVPLVAHETAGVLQVMGWQTGERVLYDGLGHDARSYRSVSRRRLLANEISWLVERS